MALLMKKLFENYHYYNTEVADSRVQDYLLMSSPWPLLAILGFYLHFVKKIGPEMMTDRPPMKLDRIMQLYDVIQIILNSYIFYKALTLGWLRDYSFFCEPVDYSLAPKAVEISKVFHLYFIVKVLDLIDTIFFVLRKKDGQVSFLHVYHHTGMTVGSWIGVKFIAGGHITFVGLINSFVHCVMYTHYLVMSMKLTKPWWKKCLTQLQLLQFALTLVQFTALFVVKDCRFPAWPAIFMIPQNLFMIVLFSDFYYKTYLAKKKPSTKNVDANEEARKDIINVKEKIH